MKTKIYTLGDNPIMFGDTGGCGACKMQKQILKQTFKKGHYLYIYSPLSKPALPEINAIPTWYIPTGNGKGYFHQGVITQRGVKGKGGYIELRDLLERKKPRVSKRSFRFGETVDADIPQIGTLAKYGKNFPNGQGFEIPNSWTNDMTQKWGNELLSGTLGREFGPGNTDRIYQNDYYNNIRMAYPGGDLDTALNTNRSCNMYNKVTTPSGAAAYPVLNSAGMIYNSKNPEIVNMSFGKRKRSVSNSRFGNKSLYSQMGPIPASNYLLDSTTFDSMYAGGGQKAPPRPYKIDNANLYIGQAPVYYPVKSETNFGNAAKKKVQSAKKVPKKEGKSLLKQHLKKHKQIYQEMDQQQMMQNLMKGNLPTKSSFGLRKVNKKHVKKIKKIKKEKKRNVKPVKPYKKIKKDKQIKEGTELSIRGGRIKIKN
jgi:hypothetical protein